MPGPLNLKRLRENIEKRFPVLQKARSTNIPSAAMDEVLLATRPKYPRLPVWENIEHPRDNYFSIHIVPLHSPLHPHLEEPIRELQKEMIADGVPQDLCKLNDPYEERFSHLWVAEIQRWVYRPIGMCTFLYRDMPVTQYAEDDGSFGSTAKEKWWLTYAWLNPAQRNHRVLRGTVPYFQKWHPDFVVGRDHVIVSKSLKDYPQHLQNRDGSSIIWG